jgi:RNA polymerase sigma-70 factor (ECF subfamily)
VSLLEIGPAVTDEATRLVDRDQIERGFRHLPVDQRAVLVLHHYVGLRPAEIAMTLGIPIGTVNSRIHYGTRTLRAALEADLRPIGAPSAERIS